MQVEVLTITLGMETTITLEMEKLLRVGEMDILEIVMGMEVRFLAMGVQMAVQMATLRQIGLEIPILSLLCHQSVRFAQEEDILHRTVITELIMGMFRVPVL
ncbi:hypothetical protein ACFX12_023545 [Malus domestica]